MYDTQYWNKFWLFLKNKGLIVQFEPVLQFLPEVPWQALGMIGGISQLQTTEPYFACSTVAIMNILFKEGENIA